MRTRTLAALIAAGLLLTACGDSAEDDGAEGDASADAGEAITVELGDMYFEPDRIEVPAGQTVTLELVNVGGAQHDLNFEDGHGSGRVDPGDTMTVEVGPFDTDTVGWCDVPGHRAAGMELEVVVD